MQIVIGIVVWFLISSLIGSWLTGGSEASASATWIIFFGTPIVMIIYSFSKNNTTCVDSANVAKVNNSRKLQKTFVAETSQNKEIKEKILNIVTERNNIIAKIDEQNNIIREIRKKHSIACFLVYGLFGKKYLTELNRCQQIINSYEKKKNSTIYSFDAVSTELFENLKQQYKAWFGASIFNVAGDNLTIYKNTFGDCLIIRCNIEPIVLNLKNTGCFYIYPNVILVYDFNGNFVDTCNFSAMNISVQQEQKTLSENIPSDSIIINQTWRYAKVNGGPDLRYSGNYQIYTMKFGKTTLNIGNIRILVTASSYQKCNDFKIAFDEFKNGQRISGVTMQAVTAEKQIVLPTTSNNKSQFRIENAKLFYKDCENIDQVIDIYVLNTQSEKLYNAVELQNLKYYLQFNCVWSKSRTWTTQYLSNLICGKATDGTSQRAEVRKQIKHQSLAELYNEHNLNQTPVQQRISEAKLRYQYCANIEQVIALYIKNTPVNKLYSNIELHTLRYYLQYICEWSRGEWEILSLTKMIQQASEDETSKVSIDKQFAEKTPSISIEETFGTSKFAEYEVNDENATSQYSTVPVHQLKEK